MKTEITRDYKDYSFNQLNELIATLYQEIDRLTAERKASDEALTKLSHNVSLSGYSINQIKEAAKNAAIDALVESRKIKLSRAKQKAKKKA